MEASQTGQESNLVTEQPDEALPSAQEAVSGRPVAGALPSTDADIYGTVPADQAQRDAQLEADAQRHNERTGGGTVVEGERQADRDLHNSIDDGSSQLSPGLMGQRPAAEQGVQPVAATDAPPGPSTQPPADPSTEPAPSPNPSAPPAEEPAPEPQQEPQNPGSEPQNPPTETPQQQPGPASPTQA